MELVADLVDVDVRDDVDRVVAAVGAARPGVEPADQVGRRRHLLEAGAEQLRQLAEVALLEQVDVVADERAHERMVDAQGVELEQQALAQVARADARRIEGLHLAERLLHQRLGHAGRAGHLVEAGAQVAVLVEVADQAARRPALVVAAGQELELPLEMVGQRRAPREGRLQRAAIVVRAHPAAGLGIGVRVAAPVELREPVALLGVPGRLALFGGLGRGGRRELHVLADLGGELLLDLAGLLEDRVLGELLLDDVDELEPRELQQLDRLLQLRRHHQLLGQLELLLELDRHSSSTRAGSSLRGRSRGPADPRRSPGGSRAG